MKALFLFGLLLTGIACGETKPEGAAKPAEAAPAPSEDLAFFTKLRMDYAKRPDFRGNWSRSDERDAVIKAFSAHDHAKAFELSGKYLEGCPVDAEIHLLRATAARYLNEVKAYTHHSHMAYGLMNSMTATGDGRTAKTGFKVIAISEEYALLHDLGLTFVSQQLVEGPCDKMNCKSRDGKDVTIYFEISIVLEAEGRDLREK